MKQLNIYLIMLLILMILVIISVLISVAFLVLMERKMLSYMQLRKGPNKLGIIGLLQSFSDAIKLLVKEMYLLIKLNYLIYLFSPLFMLMLILVMWMIYPFITNILSLNLGMLFLMCCFSLGVYGLLLTGWSSNSSYSMLGSIRSLAQSISYEVSLSLIMLILMFLVDEMDFSNLLFYQSNLWLMIFLWPMGLMFLFSIMAELNRTPFDFSEGESELVSGFNVEYMGSGFVLIFLAEYASILFLSLLFNMMFLGNNYNNFLFYFKIMFLVFFVIWLRGTLPRFRYDLLMYLCWLLILPFTLNYMFYMIFFKIFI